ncbi:MAG: alginate export family protein [Verrucomicrobia bacterium]|nr:alginate export family protein [Verrucomicrobiota bacterium]
MSNLSTTAAGALVLAITSSVYAQQAPATKSAPATKPAAKAPPSAGLVNDWLRQQSAAWAAWDIGGQFRARYELFENGSPAFPNRDFQRTGAANDNSYLWLREKLHLGYTSSWFGAYAEGRNSNSIGDNDPKNLGEDSFDLHQAYVTLGNPKEFPLSLKVGRQEMMYGDDRLIGASDWGNTGRVFDTAKVRFENKQFWVDAFAGRIVVPNDKKFNDPDHRDWFSGVYASSKTLVPIQESQFYVLSRNVAAGGSTAARDIYTVGARVKSLPGKLKGWDYAAEVLGQFGSIVQSGKRLDQEAFAASVGGGFTWAEVFASPRVGVEYNYSSGDSDKNDGKSQVLDNLFPTNHKHYGLMDFIGWRNIHNPRLSLSAKPHKKLTVGLDYHLFWLADTHDSFYPQSGSGRSSNGYGKNPAFDSFVGSELDLDVNYAVTPWAGLRAGYGHFFTGGYVDSSKAGVGGATGADWFYVQATINF